MFFIIEHVWIEPSRLALERNHLQRFVFKSCLRWQVKWIRSTHPQETFVQIRKWLHNPIWLVRFSQERPKAGSEGLFKDTTEINKKYVGGKIFCITKYHCCTSLIKHTVWLSGRLVSFLGIALKSRGCLRWEIPSFYLLQ